MPPSIKRVLKPSSKLTALIEKGNGSINCLFDGQPPIEGLIIKRMKGLSV